MFSLYSDWLLGSVETHSRFKLALAVLTGAAAFEHMRAHTRSLVTQVGVMTFDDVVIKIIKCSQCNREKNK